MKISSEDKKLLNLLKSVIVSRNIDLKKKKNIISLYEKIKSSIDGTDFTSYDINNLLEKYKSNDIVKFLQGLTTQYNTLLIKQLDKYNFKECNELKGFCSRSKIRGYKRVRDNLLSLAKKRINKWEGCWSFIDQNNCKIKNIKLIDPDVIKYISKNVS